MTEAARFRSHVPNGEPDACWLWAGRIGPDGYGWFTSLEMFGHRRPVGAHRIAWMLANGPIAPRLLVCHHCDEPGCVNPAHLFIGSQLDNMRDAKAKGRLNGGAAKARAEAK